MCAVKTRDKRKENNMNMKEMIVSIITAMVVMTMFASSAMAIAVDGIAGAGEWAPGDKLVDDTDSNLKGSASGYNISSMWAHYEGGKIYFRLDVYGTPGDMYNVTDGLEVGNEEFYEIHIDNDTNGIWDKNDYNLVYHNSATTLRKWDGYVPRYGNDTGETVYAAHSAIIEFEMPVNSHGYIDPNDFCIQGWADSDPDGLGEDLTPIECRENLPPVAVITGNDVCYCTNTQFDGSGSYDPDGTIVSYKWDFENVGTYDRVGTSPTTTWHYPEPGTYTAKLAVVDNDGLEDSATTTVEVYDHPTANASATPTSLLVGGGMVTFNGAVSDGIPPYTCTWNIGGTTYPGIGPHMVFIDHSLTATLTVVDNNDCTDTDPVRIDVATNHKVPILTPAGMLALIGMMCIVGAGRIITRGRRS